MNKTLFLYVGAALMIPSPAFAWGQEGHIIVADIAEAQLTDSARRTVRALLKIEGARSLGEIANWADAERAAVEKGKKPEFPMPSHVTRIPLNRSTDLGKSCPNLCAVKGIEYYADRLGDDTLPARDRLIALKFVVHLIGDLHQPLHSSYKVGNFTPVIFEGRKRILHWVWDVGIIRSRGLTRAKLMQEIGRTKVSARGSVVSWAIEGRDIARDAIFPGIAPKGKITTLPDDYAAVHWPVVRVRLKLAGLRLARLLNEQLGK